MIKAEVNGGLSVISKDDSKVIQFELLPTISTYLNKYEDHVRLDIGFYWLIFGVTFSFIKDYDMA